MSLVAWLAKLESMTDLKELESYRHSLFGKNGELTQQLRALGALTSADERRIQGAHLNEMRDRLTAAFQEKKAQLEEEALQAQLQSEALDLTLTHRPERIGCLHPITFIMRQIESYFMDQGFEVLQGPEVETQDNNFTHLNIPEHHPARQSHDTFYLKDFASLLLRTHTSNVQIHSLKDKKPPMRVVAMGRVYRADYDATHSPMFHQVEGFVVDKHIHMGHLKATLLDFLEDFFNLKDIPLRFRPNFFPFTEPSAEVDIGCVKKPGEPLKLSTQGEWLEILGCGMIHPNVLKNCGIDPNEYSGFAFGAGIERLLMLKYGISDIRSLYEGSSKWLNHYGFKPYEA